LQAAGNRGRRGQPGASKPPSRKSVRYAIKAGNPNANNVQGQMQSASCRVRQLLARAEGPHPLRSGSGGSSVNRELVVLYWSIGRDILSRQENEGWGAKIIDRLSEDLAKAFPEMRGFRARNLKYMRAFAEAYPDQEFVQQVVAHHRGHRVWHAQQDRRNFTANSVFFKAHLLRRVLQRHRVGGRTETCISGRFCIRQRRRITT
jgi:predicted nuclease of restriction endonuclease-like (RecB) superfamily